jgi:hypothetical protein
MNSKKRPSKRVLPVSPHLARARRLRAILSELAGDPEATAWARREIRRELAGIKVRG